MRRNISINLTDSEKRLKSLGKAQEVILSTVAEFYENPTENNIKDVLARMQEYVELKKQLVREAEDEVSALKLRVSSYMAEFQTETTPSNELIQRLKKVDGFMRQIKAAEKHVLDIKKRKNAAR